MLQEKQKAKVREKLDKCNKEKLWEFCDVLDIPITKTTTRKVIDIQFLLYFFMESSIWIKLVILHIFYAVITLKVNVQC